jgi:D-alanyl-D-alanine carboxypeptidase
MRHVDRGVGCNFCLAVFVIFFFSAVLTGLAIAQSMQGEADAVRPISATFCADMRAHHVLSSNPKVGCERLRLVKFSYFGFDDKIHDDGEMVVMDAAATHVLRIFGRLRKMRFPISRARPMNNYDGDADASTRDNNSSAFNDRNVAGGNSISLHAYGLAIDLNPVQNPYLTRSGGALRIDPAAGADHINRMNERPSQRLRSGIAEAVIRVFADDGFLIWGGYWHEPIDYQHFQTSRKLAERLAGASSLEATQSFDRVVERFQACQRKYPREALPNPACLIQADPGAGAAGKPSP